MPIAKRFRILILCVVPVFCARVSAEGLLPEQERVLRSIARGQSQPWAEMTPEQAVELYNKAEWYLEDYVRWHLPQGMNCDLLYQDDTLSSLVRYDGIGDGTTWTGHYLAALALKFSVERDETTLDRIYDTLDVFERLCLLSGRFGYIPRYAGLAGDPAYAAYYRRYGNWDDPVLPPLGKQAYRGIGCYDNYVWLGKSSRDTYDGFLFGLAMTYAFVDDPEAQDHVRRIAALVAPRMIADRFWINDGQRHIINPVPVFTCAWTRFFLTTEPWTVYLPTQMAVFSCYVPGFTRQTGEIDLLPDAYARTLPICYAFESQTTDKWEPRYSSNNLTFILCAVLSALEESTSQRTVIEAMTTRLYKDFAWDHLNPHFAAIYMMVTGDTKDNDARAVLQGQLIDFPEDKWAHRVDRTADPSIQKHNDDQSEYALLAHERVPDDFLWQRCPCYIVGGTDAFLKYPGIDMFLPYWMGRAIGAIRPPQ